MQVISNVFKHKLLSFYLDHFSVMVVVDVADKKYREEIHPDIVASLREHSHIPSVLVLNKVHTYHVCRCSCIANYYCDTDR